MGAAFDKAFDRVKAAIEADDGRSADVDKLHARPYHRAKWDCANRVLMRLAHVEQAANAQTVCLVIGLDAQALFEEYRGVSIGTRITAEGSSPSTMVPMVIPHSDMHQNTTASAAVSIQGFRVAWSSIWSGFLIAVGVVLLMTVLGLAIGVSAADVGPGQEGNAKGLGIGAAVWSGVSMIVALFLGGLVATRTGMIDDRAVKMTEGALVWVLSMLALIYMATSGIGMLSSGVFGALGGVTQGAAAAVKNVDVSQLSSGDVSQVVARMNDPATARVVATATGTSEAEARRSLADIAQRVQAAKDDPAKASAEAKAGLERLGSQAGARVAQAAEQAQPYAAATMWSTLTAMVVALIAAVAGALAGGRQAERRAATVITAANSTRVGAR